MERQWRRDELEAMKIEELRNLVKNRGLSTTGHKAKLIQILLGEKQGKQARIIKEKETPRSEPENRESEPIRKEPEIPTIKPKIIPKDTTLQDLPYEIMIEPFYKLSVKEILHSCRTSQKIDEICNDEKFWKEYARRNNIKKTDEKDTWKNIVMSTEKIYAKGEDDKYILHRILWEVNQMPVIFENGKWKSLIEWLSNEEANKVIFPTSPSSQGLKPPVTLYSPKISIASGKFPAPVNTFKVKKGWTKQGGIPTNALLYLPETMDSYPPLSEIKIIPDTPYGSTVGNVLNSIYRHIWKLNGTPQNTDINEFISFKGRDWKHIPLNFIGIEKPSESNQNKYTVDILIAPF